MKRAGVTKLVRTMRTTVNKLPVEDDRTMRAMRDLTWTEMDVMVSEEKTIECE